MDDYYLQMCEAGPIVTTISVEKRNSAGKATCTIGHHPIPCGMDYRRVVEIVDGLFSWYSECEGCLFGWP
jgi:hypothetical protein